MAWISDRGIDQLRRVVDEPDLSGTRYRLAGEIGRGGMGVVYEAEDLELGRRVALKVIRRPEIAEDAAGRLRGEAQVIARLEHPGIVPVHDLGSLPDGRVFYTMKLVRGKRLDQDLPVSEADRLRLFLRLCDAVSFAHANGVLHRDLKPENIMLGAFGEVLVMDWGLAKLLDDRAAGAGGSVAGTPGFMAPEQERPGAAVDHRADIFSLGRILAMMLGDRPSKAARAICEKASAASPGDRYASVAELSADVTRYLDRLPVTARRESIAERAVRLFERHRLAILLISGYLLMRILIILFSRH